VAIWVVDAAISKAPMTVRTVFGIVISIKWTFYRVATVTRLNDTLRFKKWAGRKSNSGALRQEQAISRNLGKITDQGKG
jgi:hypothetical protein